ncbi:unnamed protein product [marine sediment metagenome]|uniref:Uncharacterized protein n=1 Tax=marine sediment metagenome TaxID=412755 RepID=X1PK99_9ZZZZ
MGRITGTLEILDNSWTWKSDKKLTVSDLAFIDKVNPSFAIAFKRHIVGADMCEKLVPDQAKFIKCLNAVNQA